MQDNQESVLARNLVEVFNERDGAKRLTVIRELYTADATFFEAEASFTGADAINARVTEVLQPIPPEALFATTGSTTTNHNLARVSWTLGPEGGPVMVSGMDIAVLDGDRIKALYIFIDPQ